VLSGEKPCLTAYLAAFWNRASYIRSVCIIIILGYGEEWSPPQGRWEPEVHGTVRYLGSTECDGSEGSVGANWVGKQPLRCCYSSWALSG
jgi:hypothetical protein